MGNIETRYEVELNYLHKNKETNIKTEAIKYITIDNNYLATNFPVIFLKVNIISSLYDKMLKNIESDTVALTISKYDNDKEQRTTTNYIKDEFIYFFPNTDSNYNEEIEKEATDDKQSTSNAYRETHIGLLSIEIYNYTKKIYNDVISGNMQSIVYTYLKDLKKVIMEPFDTDKEMKNLLIPPIVGLNNLIDYLSDINSFYNSHHMFFIDLTKTCFLLSCNGNEVKRKANSYSSVIIDVDKTGKDSKSKALGMEKDTKNKCFKLNINRKDYNFSKNLYSDKEYNQIITIDSIGKVSKINLNNANNSKGKRVKIFRTLSSNGNKKLNLKYISSVSNAIVSVTKSNIDSSVLTPEKSYNISNPNANKKYDGDYTLISKQEIFRKEDEKYFTVVVNLKLSKTVS